MDVQYEEACYYTIQYKFCLFRAPIALAKNKSYSKALYIVQSTVTTLSVINLKQMSFQFGFE